jgi:hypothetical protein
MAIAIATILEIFIEEWVSNVTQGGGSLAEDEQLAIEDLQRAVVLLTQNDWS